MASATDYPEAAAIADAVATMDPRKMDAHERAHYEAISWHINKYLEGEN